MARGEAGHGSGELPPKFGGVDPAEAGSSRLYAPAKPHEVESGPARLRAAAGGSHPAQFEGWICGVGV
jgi:hypothetical protein